MPQILKAVYCHYTPEVRQIVSDVTKDFPHDVYMQYVHPGLDDYHEWFYQAYCKHFAWYLTWTEKFPFHYHTNWSSEWIFHVLSDIATKWQSKNIYVLNWEYEWYEGYGSNLWLKFTKVSYDELLVATPWIVFISNPSSRDGNIITNEDIAKIGDSGHEIYYDISYFWITKPFVMDISHPAIQWVFTSLSKPFWLYYYRVGMYLSKREMLTLKPNRWFKNILNIIIWTKVLETLKPFELYEKYHEDQKKVVAYLNDMYKANISASDVLMLATCPEVPSDHPERKEFVRWPKLRLCLTDYLLEQENI